MGSEMCIRDREDAAGRRLKTRSQLTSIGVYYSSQNPFNFSGICRRDTADVFEAEIEGVIRGLMKLKDLSFRWVLICLDNVESLTLHFTETPTLKGNRFHL